MNSLNPVMRIEDQMIDAIVAHEGGASKQALDARVDGPARPRSACRRDGRPALPARAVAAA